MRRLSSMTATGVGTIPDGQGPLAGHHLAERPPTSSWPHTHHPGYVQQRSRLSEQS